MFSTASKKTSHQVGKDTWQTPWSVFAPLLTEFDFTIDGAADQDNTLLPRWWGPQSTLSEDALSADWEGERVWCNPPYSLAAQFVEKAFMERARCTAVLLIPSRTDTRWWHNCIWDQTCHDWHVRVRGRFVKGRLKFSDPSGQSLRNTPQSRDKYGRPRTNNSAPFPSAIIVFGEA
jgi:site-specific DNA-methyltransferase (adenine-specific)